MEKKYYYINSSGAQFGPLTLSELIGAGITPDTYVWCAGFKEWVQAMTVPEIAAYLQPEAQQQPAAQSVTPSYTNPAGYNDYEAMPNTYLGWSIAAAFLCCMPAAIVAIVYAAQVSPKWLSGDRAGARRSAQLARTWFWVSFSIGFLVYISYFLLIFGTGLSLISVLSNFN